MRSHSHKEIEDMLARLQDRRREAEHVLANADSEIEALEWSLGNRGDIPLATSQLSDIVVPNWQALKKPAPLWGRLFRLSISRWAAQC